VLPTGSSACRPTWRRRACSCAPAVGLRRAAAAEGAVVGHNASGALLSSSRPSAGSSSRPSARKLGRRQEGTTKAAANLATAKAKPNDGQGSSSGCRQGKPSFGDRQEVMMAAVAAAAQQAHGKTRKIDGVGTSSLRPRQRRSSTLDGERSRTRWRNWRWTSAAASIVYPLDGERWMTRRKVVDRWSVAVHDGALPHSSRRRARAQGEQRQVHVLDPVDAGASCFPGMAAQPQLLW
jgi:hypothetical protein